MSDQLFLLTIPDFCPWKPAVLNAIAYSWLENLESPDFPYNLPIQKYTQTEVGVRLERVSCLLDRLSRGLLEMSRKRSGGVDGNDYFSYEIGFLHRSVREYISNTRELQLRDHGPAFDAYSGIFRLQLTEFKFALSTSDDTDLETWVERAGEGGVLRAKLDDLLLMLAWANSIGKYDIPSRFLEEIGHIVEEYSRMVRTRRQDLPENNTQAFKGHRIWGTNRQHSFHRAWRRRESQHPPDLLCDLVYCFIDLQCLSSASLGRLKQQNSTSGPNLLLVAAISFRSELVEQLLLEGRSPKEMVLMEPIRPAANDFRVQPITIPAKTVSQSVWLIFLFNAVEQFIWRGYADVSDGRCFEEFLKYNVHGDVLFVLRIFPPSKEMKDAGYHHDPWGNERESDDRVVFDLLEYLEVAKPTNLKAIRTRLSCRTGPENQHEVTLISGPPIIHRHGDLSKALAAADEKRLTDSSIYPGTVALS
ncbi:hypothetical protein N7509_007676 [Penicillium cosmopolitanum]|uniref:DUF7791 domain-containing protein n=1 Tax=Penicillium cosmopolitanum TaxID=1131564 RepID=A0A9W9VZL7_9EURO|nr:uncharacterized protein N7509_007676 [Penicillium cosmopolitanum]KAJ5392186.1 hypothetical protein N7509_007676 [Penicillium cosmopolitanum]